jgi:hypothetical protein
MPTQSTQWRPQPPSITDPEAGDYMGDEMGEEAEDQAGIETEVSDDDQGKKAPNWLRRAKDSFRFSTSYVDSNYRQKWDDSIKAFNNQHPGDSKYLGELFKKRSNLFRPKTRAIIRKNEAAAAAAFFSNMDLLDVSAQNQEDKAELVSADVMKQLLQYRLTKTIPWFQVCMGGIQDAQVQGAVCAHVYWRFLERHDEQGRAESLEDKPVIDLRPIENIRIDPSASWHDPIGTSPYLIDMIPMYWCDVKDRMDYPNPKGQRWKKYSSTRAFAYTANEDDSTRASRNMYAQDPQQQKRTISDYDIVWIHRHIHRWDGEDWEFYTISSQLMLTDPEPLKNTVWHGHRPYVMGSVILETHKTIPTSVPQLVKPLQDEANVISNQRKDNVSFVLNKRYLAKRGKNVDLASLVRNVPGGITLVDNVEEDVKEMTWPDVTQSAYLEEDRVDSDFSDLVGNFNPMQVTAQRSGRESTNTMRMLQGPSNLLTEYMLKTYVETFVQPVLRHIVMLEQQYETDMVILKLAGQKAQAFQKYGVSQMTDAILDKELTVQVNVGMGATDPQAKLQRWVYWLMTYEKFVQKVPPGIDLKEIWKEGCALSGYQDGSRFQIDGQDPTVASLMQKIQQLTMALQKGPTASAQSKHEANQIKDRTNRRDNLTKIAIAGKQHDSKARLALFEHLAEQERAGMEREGEVEDRDFGAAKDMTMADKQQEGSMAQAKLKSKSSAKSG